MALDSAIHNSIISRYNNLTSCSLSCGNNLGYADIRSGSTVLDLGCGSGKTLLEALNIIGPSGKAIGIDISPQMIREASERLKHYNNINLMNDRFDTISLEDASVDVVISNCAINHVTDKQTVYSEIYRVLKNGGSFVVSDIATKVSLPGHIKDDPEQWADCFGGAITEDEYLAILNASSFKNITILERREYIKRGFDFVSLTFSGHK